MHNITCKTGVQPVQNQWSTGGVRLHTFRSRLLVVISAGARFPTFYYLFTHTLTQAVHKISAILTDTGGRFSALFTGPITTTTTFIYKNIEKEAA